MDRRTFITITLCFLVLFGWQKLYIEPRSQMSGMNVPMQGTGPGNTANQDQAVSTQAKNLPAPVPPPAHAAEKLVVHTAIGDSVVGDGPSFFLDWNLKTYKLGITPQAAAVDMRSVTQQSGQVGLAFDDPAYAYLSEVQGKLTASPQGATWNYEDQNVKLSRVFLVSNEAPFIDLQVTAEFKNKPPRYAFLSLSGEGVEKDPEAQDRQLTYFTNDSLERVHLKDDIEQKGISTPVKFIGVSNRYFTMNIINKSPVQPNGLVQPIGKGAGRISMVYPLTGNSITLPVRVYFGPKELNVLRQVEPALDHTVDFGWFTVFAYPLLKLLKWLYQFFHNYGLAIIVLTLILKIATFPLTYKSMKSMKNMAKLQPQLQRIREKHKNDREALNREMLVLMKNHGYNPMAGCLPILIQMPIFFALYRVLYSSIELYHAPFALWIRDLSTSDPFYVTPILLSLTMFIQQKLTPTTATDPAQAKMMQLMPLIFGAFMLALPSGLTLYMLVNAVASIIQQMILNKKFDVSPQPA